MLEINEQEALALPVDALALFEAFALAHRHEQVDPLSAQSARGYLTIWRRWLSFLAGRNVSWLVARDMDVAAFCNSGLSPRKHSAESRVSAVSRRRYWRVLQRVYSHGVTSGVVALSPFLAMGLGQQPVNVAQNGTVLPMNVWQALPRFFVDQEQRPEVQVRNSAILWLLYACGLAPQEVRDLQLQHLVFSGSKSTSRPVGLRIEGPRALQHRVVELDDQVSQALAHWLVVRQGDHPYLAVLPWVFYTRKGAPLSGPVLFRLACAAINRTGAAVGIEIPRRLGPQILRNSLIRNWLNDGVDPSVVAIRMGLKDVKSLARLGDVVNPEVRIPRRRPPTEAIHQT